MNTFKTKTILLIILTYNWYSYPVSKAVFVEKRKQLQSGVQYVFCCRIYLISVLLDAATDVLAIFYNHIQQIATSALDLMPNLRSKVARLADR